MRHSNHRPATKGAKYGCWVLLFIGVLITSCNLCAYLYYVSHGASSQPALPISKAVSDGGADVPAGDDSGLSDDISSNNHNNIAPGGGGGGEVSDNNNKLPHDPHNMVFHQQDAAAKGAAANKAHHKHRHPKDKKEKKGGAAAEDDNAAADPTTHLKHHNSKKGGKKEAVATEAKQHHRQDDAPATEAPNKKHRHHKKAAAGDTDGEEDANAVGVIPHGGGVAKDSHLLDAAHATLPTKKEHRRHHRGTHASTADGSGGDATTVAPADGDDSTTKGAHHKHNHNKKVPHHKQDDEVSNVGGGGGGSSFASEAPIKARTMKPSALNASLASHLLRRKKNIQDANADDDTVAAEEEVFKNDMYKREDFNKMSFDDAVTLYNDDYVKKVLSTEIEQSSNRFTDYEERGNHGVLLPTLSPSDLLSRFNVGPAVVGNDNATTTNGWCDPQDADFNEVSDEACIRYLLDIRNMLSIKPMASILSTGRTIKFKIYYRHNHTQAVMKVGQKKFILEPSSEVMAFHTDRVLGFNRVPPVAWAPVPIDFLKAGAASMDAFYAQWFQKFVLSFDQAKPLITPNCYIGEGEKASVAGCLNVSLQLWMADVHVAEDTIVNPPRKYRAALELYNSAESVGVNGGGVGDASKLAKMEEAKKSLASPKFHYAVGELANQFLFDFIIGNSDRWFGHNSFALGGCESDVCSKSYASKPWTKSRSSARLAYIDQGSSFYGRSGPEMNPFTKNVGTLCRFNSHTAQNLLDIIVAAPAEMEAGGKAAQKPGYALYKRVKDRLPKGIFYVASSYLLKAAGSRAERAAKQIRDCLSNFTRSDVMYFE